MGTTSRPVLRDPVRAELEEARRHGRWHDVARLLVISINTARRSDMAARRRALRLELAEVLTARLGHYDAALAVLAVMYEETQNDPDINFQLAESLFAAGEHDEARGMYEWLLLQAVVPASALARVMTRLGQLAALRGDVPGARERLEQAALIDRGDTEALNTLALLRGESSETVPRVAAST